MSDNLKSSDFGLKIYSRFPPKYREDDEGQKLALKRYLQALSDGGFKYCIDDINRLKTLIDPDSVDIKILTIMFEQYGLEVFNGIPETYLRYLLPNLSEAWSKKGSLSVIDFVASTVYGMKSNPVIRFDKRDENGNIIGYDYSNPIIDIKFEMDYNSVGNYFPKTEHLSRILSNFVPFYCDMNIVHTYMFYEEQVVKMHDSTLEAMSISESIKEESILSVDDTDVKCEENLNMSVVTETQEFWNIDLTNSLTNSFNVLNSDFCTNGLVSYDIARKSNGEVEMYY